MAEVTAQMVKELRERTQAGMSDCKAALVEAGGEIEKAVEIILKKGLAKSAKRAGAVATEGEVRAQVAPDGKSGVIVEVNIQTDFSARNDKFKHFVDAVVEVAQTANEGEDLGQKPYPGAGGKTVEEVRKELSGTIGENIQVRRWHRFDIKGEGFVQAYAHKVGDAPARIGVLIEIDTVDAKAATHPRVRSFAEDVAMHIAAASPAPQYVHRSHVPGEALDKQTEIFKSQLKEDNKPEAAWAKIIEGKKNKWYSEVALLEQESVVNPGTSIDKLRAELAAEAGGEVKLLRFARFERGEGIEKATGDFAAEVAKLAGG